MRYLQVLGAEPAASVAPAEGAASVAPASEPNEEADNRRAVREAARIYAKVRKLGADIYLFSSYKTYGPHQGVMVIRRALGEALPNQGHYFNADTLYKRFTPAGPDHAQIAACAGCHSPNGAGIPAQYPRLAGQHADYAVAQLTAFRDGVRKNSLQMTGVAAKMNDREIKAVSDYIAGLR